MPCPPDTAVSVLDVGCGTGGITLAVARRLASAGRCMGVDISEPVIAAARARAEREGTPASFVRADAQDHAFEPASFDFVISRFGVMFFDDSVRAFANLRRASTDDGRLRFIAWRGAAENPFMTTAERAAAPLLPDLPARRPDEPGQFAFADPDRIRRILADSGWAEIDIQPIDVACALPEKELARYLTRLGPVGLALREADEQTRGTGPRNGSGRVRPLCAGHGGPLHRGLLDGRRPRVVPVVRPLTVRARRPARSVLGEPDPVDCVTSGRTAIPLTVRLHGGTRPRTPSWARRRWPGCRRRAGRGRAPGVGPVVGEERHGQGDDHERRGRRQEHPPSVHRTSTRAQPASPGWREQRSRQKRTSGRLPGLAGGRGEPSRSGLRPRNFRRSGRPFPIARDERIVMAPSYG